MIQPSRRSRSTSLALLAVQTLTAVGAVNGFRAQQVSVNSIIIRGGSTRIFSQPENETSLLNDYQHDDVEDGKTFLQFGQATALSSASFGQSVPLKRPTTSGFERAPVVVPTPTPTTTTNVELPPELKAMKQRNTMVAIASVLLAVSSYLWQFTHPITPLQILSTMQSNSAPLTAIGTNGKPTVVDFWAPWCDNCKMAAPTLQKLEQEYQGQINFVLVNGDRPDAWPLVERFGVDAIPHLALINAQGDVETALIGPIPKRILEADLEVLLANAKGDRWPGGGVQQELPYKMLDVFVNSPQDRRIRFPATATIEPTK